MILIVDPSPSLRAMVAEKLLAPVRAVQVSSLAEINGALRADGDGSRVVVLGPGLDRDDALRYARQVDEERNGVRTLLVAEELDPALLREAVRAHVGDVLTVEATPDEWTEAIERVEARSPAEDDAATRTDAPAGERGRIVTVFSTKGGCGKSLVTANLGVLAARETGEQVALVDLDLQAGDLSILFQLMPALSIYDAAQSAGQLDTEAMQGYLTPHPSGVALLAAPMVPSLADQVPAEAVGRILELLRESFPLTIVDSPALFTDQVLVALDASDLIVLIGSKEVPSLKNLHLAMKTLEQLGHPAAKMRVVLNRADSKVGLRTQDIETLLAAKVDVKIPSSREVPQSVNQGTPLAASRARSPVVQAIAELLPAAIPGVHADAPKGLGGRRRQR